MLKKTLCALLLVPALWGSQAQANYYENCNSCCDSCLDDWSIYADYLYWRARRCDLDYAVDYTNAVFAQFSDSIHAVEPCYDNGVRVGVRKECGKSFYLVDYTYYNTSESNSVSNADGFLAGTRHIGNFDGLTQGDILFAKGKWDLDYNVVSVLGGYHLNNCNRCFTSYFAGGFKYASIDQELRYEYRGPVNQISGAASTGNGKQSIDMNAYGVNLGLGAALNFCGCFSFFGDFSFDVLVGDYTRKLNYVTLDGSGQTPLVGGVAELKDECWELVGVANLTLGLGYTYEFDCCCWCGDLNFAIGYEFHEWLNQPGFIDLESDGDQINPNRETQRLGLDGLFVRVGLGF